MPPVQRLLDICLSKLKYHTSAINDVGDMPYSLIRDILFLMPAEQLQIIEERSPHLQKQTEEIWQQLCLNDFVKIRIQVEDGKLLEVPESWRNLYAHEVELQQEKMEQVLAKMRGIYKTHADERATIKQVDGIREMKRKRSGLTPNARPKSLMQKVRTESKYIRSIYAPRRKAAPPISTSLNLTAPMGSSASAFHKSQRKVPINPVKTKLVTALVPTKRVVSPIPSRKPHSAPSVPHDGKNSLYPGKALADRSKPTNILHGGNDMRKESLQRDTLHSTKSLPIPPSRTVRKTTGPSIFLPKTIKGRER